MLEKYVVMGERQAGEYSLQVIVMARQCCLMYKKNKL